MSFFGTFNAGTNWGDSSPVTSGNDNSFGQTGALTQVINAPQVDTPDYSNPAYKTASDFSDISGKGYFGGDWTDTAQQQATRYNNNLYNQSIVQWVNANNLPNMQDDYRQWVDDYLAKKNAADSMNQWMDQHAAAIKALKGYGYNLNDLQDSPLTAWQQTLSSPYKNTYDWENFVNSFKNAGQMPILALDWTHNGFDPFGGNSYY